MSCQQTRRAVTDSRVAFAESRADVSDWRHVPPWEAQIAASTRTLQWQQLKSPRPVRMIAAAACSKRPLTGSSTQLVPQANTNSTQEFFECTGGTQGILCRLALFHAETGWRTRSWPYPTGDRTVRGGCLLTCPGAVLPMCSLHIG